MKFSGNIEDGTSKKPLNFGNVLWPWQRSALSECFSSYYYYYYYYYFYVPALALQATIHSCTRQKGRKDSDGRVQDVGLRIPECL